MRSDEELYEIIETDVKSFIENIARAYEDLVTGCIKLKTKLTPEEIDRVFGGSRDKEPLIFKYVKSEEDIQKQIKEKLKHDI